EFGPPPPYGRMTCNVPTPPRCRPGPPVSASSARRSYSSGRYVSFTSTLAHEAPGDVVYPDESAPSASQLAPPPPVISSSVMVAYAVPSARRPWMVPPPPPAAWQLAIASPVSSSQVSSNRAAHALT